MVEWLQVTCAVRPMLSKQACTVLMEWRQQLENCFKQQQQCFCVQYLFEKPIDNLNIYQVVFYGIDSNCNHGIMNRSQACFCPCVNKLSSPIKKKRSRKNIKMRENRRFVLCCRSTRTDQSHHWACINIDRRGVLPTLSPQLCHD